MDWALQATDGLEGGKAPLQDPPSLQEPRRIQRAVASQLVGALAQEGVGGVVAVAAHGKCSPLMSNGLLLLLGQFLDHAICLLYRCL